MRANMARREACVGIIFACLANFLLSAKGSQQDSSETPIFILIPSPVYAVVTAPSGCECFNLCLSQGVSLIASKKQSQSQVSGNLSGYVSARRDGRERLARAETILRITCSVCTVLCNSSARASCSKQTDSAEMKPFSMECSGLGISQTTRSRHIIYSA